MPPAETTETAWLEYTDAALHRLVALHLRVHAADAADRAVAPGADEVEAARQRFLGSLDDEHSGFAQLVSNALLSDAEAEVLAFAVACEIDTRRLRLVAHLQDDPAATRLSFHTIGLMLGGLDRCTAAIGPDSRLRRAALLEISGDGPWAQHTVTVPAQVVWAFLGDTSADTDLPPRTRVYDLDDGGGESDGVVERGRIVVVAGADKVRRRQAAMSELARSTVIVAPVPGESREWAAVVREATMIGCGVVVELDGTLPADGRRWIERADHLDWAITSPAELPIADLPDRPSIEVDASTDELTEAEWAEAFGPDVAHIHRLSPEQVEQVRKVFGARGSDIDAAVRRLLAGADVSLVQRIKPRRSWDDLVLKPAQLASLRSIVSRYRHGGQVYDQWGFSAIPSRGLVALFAGASGTGKTLAAEVLASELRLDIFKVDLSAVVSKYIGETERNLDQVFDAAGTGNVVLFFDEADALFGKRSDVKDARDRYANIEVSHLLQRIERFDGVVVLATNFEKIIDDAFSRRIHARIEFVAPGPAERLAIWQRHLPAGAPLADADLPWLAYNLEMSGGQIRNAAIEAAFLAAESDRPITMASLVKGAANELRKAGRLLRPADFGEWYGVLAED